MMEIICKNNPEVICQGNKCESCGWDPVVAKARVEVVRKNISNSQRYRIPFTGYCEVWANSQKEAIDKANNDEMFIAHYEFGYPQCL